MIEIYHNIKLLDIRLKILIMFRVFEILLLAILYYVRYRLCSVEFVENKQKNRLPVFARTRDGLQTFYFLFTRDYA